MKKILSIVLALAMVFSILSINASAEGITYNGTASIAIKADNTFNPDNFAYNLTINDEKVGAFDDSDPTYTYKINSMTTFSGESYFDDPEAFLAYFASEDFDGGAINIDFTIEFDSNRIFGTVEYVFTIKGFSAPIDTGELGGLLGGVAGDVSANLPTDIVYKDVVPGIPTIDVSSIQIKGQPEKSDYYDYEKFDPDGTKLEFALSNGESGTFTYDKDNAHMFSFTPSASEHLSCYDSEVAIFVGGIHVISTPITVNHKWSDGYVNITTDKYTTNKPGYHAIVCEGCGETKDAQNHVVDPTVEWTYNNDETFVANGTESNTCVDCGTELIRDKFHTAGFNTSFEDFHFIKVIFEYINVLLRFIGAATY